MVQYGSTKLYSLSIEFIKLDDIIASLLGGVEEAYDMNVVGIIDDLCYIEKVLAMLKRALLQHQETGLGSEPDAYCLFCLFEIAQLQHIVASALRSHFYMIKTIAVHVKETEGCCREQLKRDLLLVMLEFAELDLPSQMESCHL
jgi:hypothetical protein